MTTVKVDIKNSPSEYAENFIVVRFVDNELWYYGTYHTEERAQLVAEEIENGIVLIRG